MFVGVSQCLRVLSVKYNVKGRYSNGGRYAKFYVFTCVSSNLKFGRILFPFSLSSDCIRSGDFAISFGFVWGKTVVPRPSLLVNLFQKVVAHVAVATRNCVCVFTFDASVL